MNAGLGTSFEFHENVFLKQDRTLGGFTNEKPNKTIKTNHANFKPLTPSSFKILQ